MSTQRDPTDLRGQERDAETEEVGARARREREVNDLKWLMAHPQGRRIVARLLDQAGVSRTSFSHSGSVMAFNEGRRDMGLLMEIMNICGAIGVRWLQVRLYHLHPLSPTGAAYGTDEFYQETVY